MVQASTLTWLSNNLPREQ